MSSRENKPGRGRNEDFSAVVNLNTKELQRVKDLWEEFKMSLNIKNGIKLKWAIKTLIPPKKKETTQICIINKAGLNRRATKVFISIALLRKWIIVVFLDSWKWLNNFSYATRCARFDIQYRVHISNTTHTLTSTPTVSILTESDSPKRVNLLP